MNRIKRSFVWIGNSFLDLLIVLLSYSQKWIASLAKRIATDQDEKDKAQLLIDEANEELNK